MKTKRQSGGKERNTRRGRDMKRERNKIRIEGGRKGVEKET